MAADTIDSHYTNETELLLSHKSMRIQLQKLAYQIRILCYIIIAFFFAMLSLLFSGITLNTNYKKSEEKCRTIDELTINALIINTQASNQNPDNY